MVQRVQNGTRLFGCVGRDDIFVPTDIRNDSNCDQQNQCQSQTEAMSLGPELFSHLSLFTSSFTSAVWFGAYELYVALLFSFKLVGEDHRSVIQAFDMLRVTDVLSRHEATGYGE
jgi:hypothetical protein